MKLEEFKNIIIEEGKIYNLEFNDKQIDNLYNYMTGIIDWNDKVNVTAIVDEKMFIVKHFIDSLTINGYIKGKERIIDIGTGGGFPGIPLKILNFLF